MSASVRSFVLDADAKRADDTGSAVDLGVRGLVVDVIPDHVDDQTGEIDDLLIVATRRHGRLEFATIALQQVADSWPCGRIDAAGYITVCQRELARAKRGSVDQRVVKVLALCTAIKDAPTTPQVGNVRPLLQPVDEPPAPGFELRPPSDKTRAAADAARLQHAMAKSTAAHQRRKESA